ncbi:MAG TPA: ABC transporter permease [Vicinamibacterales bacterium]|nr:ABC transporter permease [Vicinamibacterales bacterium]
MRPWNVKRLFRFPFRSRAAVREDIAEEFSFHLDMRTDELKREGKPAADARAQARREFGNADAGVRACASTGDRLERKRRLASVADEFRQDVRMGLRLLGKSPGFAAVAIVTLALGIGANTAIYSVLDTLLLRPLPYPESHRLVQISETLESGRPNSVSGGAFLDWRAHATQFEAIALTGRVAYNLRGATTTERLIGLEVTHEFFRVLGVPLLLGRGFLPEEDRPGGPSDVVIITEELWRSRFGTDAAIVGRAIVLDEVPRTVVGVLPAGAWVIRDDAFFVPAVLTPGTPRAERSPHWAAVFGRLAPDRTVSQADAELKSVKQQLASEYPAFKQQWSVVVEPAVEVIRGLTRGPVLILFAAVAVVLLIACANVANLLIARGCHRQQELAVRAAIGATGSRLLRQVLTENVVLAACGGFAGVGVAYLGIAALRGITAESMPLSLTPRLDERALLFSLAATLAAGLLAGVLPALRARRPNINTSLTDGGRGGTGVGRQRTQAWLVIGEVALTVILLTSAGLLLRSLANASSVDPGFDPERVLAFDVSLPDTTYTSSERRLAFATELVERLRGLPGVTSAGSGMAVPFSGGGYGEFFRRPDADARDRALGRLDFVSPGYLEALGARLRAGRGLTEADNRADGPAVVVVNETTARTFFPGGQAVGEPLSIAGTTWRIVGVVADIVDRRLDDVRQPFAYAPRAFNMSQLSIAVRTPVDPLTLVATIRREVERLDAGVAVANPRALDHAMIESLAQRKAVLGLVTAFAVVALVLASIGLYGVMAYAVANRRRELGIRLALGAKRSEVMREVLRHGLTMMGVGLVIGLAGVAATGRLLASELYQVPSGDPLAIAGTAAMVGMVAVLASLIPAMRAARVDPISVLRSE